MGDKRMGQAAFKLAPRTPAVSSAPMGRIMTTADVAVHVCGGKRGRKWVVEHMGPAIGNRPGKEWFFEEERAREWWALYVRTGRVVQ